jgi:type IV secretory pathway TrbL component
MSAKAAAAHSEIAAAEESAIQGVADAMRDAASTASEHAARVRATVGDAGPRALRAIARTTYVSAYVVSYGVVYGAVFIAQALPQENALMHGLRDGAIAARDALRGG